MTQQLNGLRVGALVTHGFEQIELTERKRALEAAGARVDTIAPEAGKVRAWNGRDWGDEFRVDRTLGEVRQDEYDAVLLPGGVLNPDKLRMNPDAVAFVREAYLAGKPIAAICHGPWTLIDAGVVRGRRMTSYPSLKTDLVHAGATWVDEEVVVDSGLVTSRRPDDLPAFNRKMLEEFGEGRHERPARQVQPSA